MSDIVFIHDLQVSCVIGVFDWERKIKQKLSFDIEMAADTTAAAKSDDLNDALDYKEVAKRVIERVENNEDLLVEKLANDLVDMIQNDFSVGWVRLKLQKLGAVTGSKSVGVIICLLYTSPSPRDRQKSRMPSSA